MSEIRIKRNLRFMNVGEDPPNPPPNWIGMRQWEACKKYGFMSAGQHPKFSTPLLNIEQADIIAAYITGSGYVGIGRITETAVPIKKFSFNGKTLSDFNIDRRILDDKLVNNETVEGMPLLRKTLFRNAYNEKTEFVIRVEWIETVTRATAYWERKQGLFAKPMIQCKLDGQPRTIQFLEDSFQIRFV